MDKFIDGFFLLKVKIINYSTALGGNNYCAVNIFNVTLQFTGCIQATFISWADMLLNNYNYISQSIIYVRHNTISLSLLLKS